MNQRGALRTPEAYGRTEAPTRYSHPSNVSIYIGFKYTRAQMVSHVGTLGRSIEPDVLLINPPYPRRHSGGVVPPIGLCYLAATLREHGATPSILDFAALVPDYGSHNHDETMRVVAQALSRWESKGPLLVGIGPLVTASLGPVGSIIALCRERFNTKVVVGGPLCAVPGFSTVAANFLAVDAYVAGDGETPLAGIWDVVSHGRAIRPLPGVWIPGCAEPSPYREPDLDQLPIPDRTLLPLALYRASARREVTAESTTAAFLSRGCPYSCTFCAAPLSSGKAVRRLSPARVTEEIQSCVAAGVQHVIFYDDCLFIRGPKLEERVLEFATALRAGGWFGTFQLELRCDAVTNLSETALSALVETGCRQINMGIEKAQLGQLRRLRKALSPTVAREACERLDASGLRAAGTFIMGGPGEDESDLEATVVFAESLPLDFAHFNPLAVYPGTQLFTELFGSPENVDWLRMCLDRSIAPRGDILWSDSELPLEQTLAWVAEAYRRFYVAERLKRTVSKLPAEERPLVVESYTALAVDRALSWAAEPSPDDARSTDCGLAAC